MRRGSDDPVPGWLHPESLERVWARIGEALERRDLVARGRVEIGGLTRAERHDLSDVLGRPVTTDLVRVDLDALERHVAARAGRDLAGVVGWILRRQLVDRGAHRRTAARQREAPFDVARAWLADHAADGRSPAPWVEAWLGGLRRDGLLTSVESAGRMVELVLEVLAARNVISDSGTSGRPGSRVVARTDLAARVMGTAHGLDDDTKVAHLVLRAAAARAGAGLPRTAADRRSLWESIGVVTDRVSSTCLMWGVRPDGPPGTSAAAPPAAPVVPRHLTWWDLETDHGWAPGQRVLVCENPRTLEALAEVQVPGLGVVCTMGRPNLVVRAALAELKEVGATLRYHGDFDWAGVALANSCLREFGAVPWLMGADDYQGGRGSEPLKGTAVQADWDPELAPAMQARGLAVHEEAVLDTVLSRVPDLDE